MTVSLGRFHPVSVGKRGQGGAGRRGPLEGRGTAVSVLSELEGARVALMRALVLLEGLSRPCEGCGAVAGEPCLPGCLSEVTP